MCKYAQRKWQLTKKGRESPNKKPITLAALSPKDWEKSFQHCDSFSESIFSYIEKVSKNRPPIACFDRKTDFLKPFFNRNQCLFTLRSYVRTHKND